MTLATNTNANPTQLSPDNSAPSVALAASSSNLLVRHIVSYKAAVASRLGGLGRIPHQLYAIPALVFSHADQPPSSP